MVAGQPVAVESPATTHGSYRDGGGTVRSDPGARRIGRIDFFDHRGLHEIGLAGGREELADFGERKVDDLGARFLDESFRRAHDQLDVAAGLRG